MSSNKLTTMGYFINRLRNSGYIVDKLFNNYSMTDPRAWTIIIDPGVASVLCTCYINRNDIGDVYFEIYDGGQFIPEKLKIKTNSIEVIVGYLAKFGIHNKAKDYNRNI